MIQWTPAGNADEPRDQVADLPGGYWAEVGPDYPEGWTWTVLVFDGEDNIILAGGRKPTEADAKRAAETNANKIKELGLYRDSLSG